MLLSPHADSAFAVIPTVVVSTPFLLLAWLFPAAFGALSVRGRRRLALLVVLSLNSTLYLLYAWLGGRIGASGKLPAWALWGLLTLVALTGAIWSRRRQRRLYSASARISRGEMILLLALSLTGFVGAVWWLRDGTWKVPPGRDLLVLCVLPWSGVLVALLPVRRWPDVETVMLGALTVACVVVAVAVWPRSNPDVGVAVVWTFEPPARGAIVATPLVDGDRLFVPTIRDGDPPTGVVYCLQRETGKIVWHFDDDGKMQHSFSSPCLADGRLFFGEGMHANYVCNFYCLEAATGRKRWQATTAGHIESSPCVADGRVYFGSGDDGLYCLDAATGAERWHFTERVHIDSSPVVAGGRVYFGSGVSRTRKTTIAFCLDAVTGCVVWREPTDLPVWGSPSIDREDVFFGLGNGRIDQSAPPPEKPAGAVLCLEAETGRKRWRYDVADGVFGRPVVDGDRVTFAARDSVCYCLSRHDGMLHWKQDLGSPVVTSPVLSGDRLYLAATAGRVCCLAADNGTMLWTFDVAAHTQTRPRLYSSPIVVADELGGRRIYLGTELRLSVNSSAVLYCLRD